MSSMRVFKNLDWLILFPTLIISFLGLLIILSINPKFVGSQFIFLILGLFLYYLLANFDYKILERFSLPPFFLSLGLLLLTFILGRVTRGSIRWIQIGSLSFQSSEFVKPLLILSFASLASQLDFSKVKNILIFLVFLFIPAFLIFKQPDLGNSLVVLAIGLAIILSAGIRKIHVSLGLIVFFLLLPLLWNFLKPYQKQRIVTFLNPNFDPLGSGYHLLQATITVGSGQLFGRELGGGTQGQLRFLPESHTDFIFASFAEELGFLGATLLLLAYLVLLSRILVFSQRAPDRFGLFICIGVFSMIFFQTFVNIGMNLGLVPVTGITLPLFSSGGSSLVATLISLGLVQSVGHFLKREEVVEIK